MASPALDWAVGTGMTKLKVTESPRPLPGWTKQATQASPETRPRQPSQICSKTCALSIESHLFLLSSPSPTLSLSPLSSLIGCRPTQVKSPYLQDHLSYDQPTPRHSPPLHTVLRLCLAHSTTTDEPVLSISVIKFLLPVKSPTGCHG